MNKDDLLKLAVHLESGILGHANFDFSDFNGGPYSPNGCGSSGCAIGELPILFPEKWTFGGLDKWPQPINCPRVDKFHAYQNTANFFEIELEEAMMLFSPGQTDWDVFMKWDAPATMVAYSIRIFVEWKETLS